MQHPLLSILPLFAALSLSAAATQAQVITSPQPVVYSQTVIAIVPGSTVPKTLGESPLLQTPPQQAEQPATETEGEEEEESVEDPENESGMEEAKDITELEAEQEKSATEEISEMLAEQPLAATITFRVQVRGDQIPVESGLFTNYNLDASNAVLTYFPQAEPRRVIAENIQKPLDILFVRDDGVVAQIIPEVVPAYLAEEIEVTFPLRALLYIEAGLAQALGIQPGYRIEHGMFRAKPLIYTAPEPGATQVIP